MKSQYLHFLIVVLVCFSPLIMGFWLLFSAISAQEQNQPPAADPIISEAVTERNAPLFFRSGQINANADILQAPARSSLIDSASTKVDARTVLANQLRNEVRSQNVLGVLTSGGEEYLDMGNGYWQSKTSGDEVIGELYRQPENIRLQGNYTIIYSPPGMSFSNIEAVIRRNVMRLQSVLVESRTSGTQQKVHFVLDVFLDENAYTSGIAMVSSSASIGFLLDDISKVVENWGKWGQIPAGVQSAKIRLSFDFQPSVEP